ncbi:hypothetical protein OH76DRAFT_1033139 [Lentinus brumalis]|uniref:Uncharacterized protein n=1 Tax=Lentinus brumalis TaxID=2498619 RepID=A0A371CXH9_9APHY|nr:hypothetical protein OH76DRAFT_1033139 [Polyporus brumalis]
MMGPSPGPFRGSVLQASSGRTADAPVTFAASTTASARCVPCLLRAPHKEVYQVPPANCEDVRTSTRRGDTLDVVVLMPAVTARQEVLAQSLTETVRGGLDAGTAWVKHAPDVDPNLVPFEAPRDVSATAEARARHTGSAHLSSSIPALAQWTM